MAPKRSAATAWGSPSDASDAEGDAGHGRRDRDDPPSDTDPSKTPPPNPNPKSSAAAPSSTPSVAADSTAAGSDSGGTYDSDAEAHRRPAPKPAASSPKPGGKPRARSPGINSDSYNSEDSDAEADRRLAAPKAAPSSPKPGGKPRARSPGINSDSEDSAAPVASDADLDPAAGADSEDDNVSPLRSARRPRAEASIIKPISSRPMDSPPRGSASASEPRVKRPRSAAISAPSPDPLKRPSRLWSHGDELLILRGLATYRAKSGVLPGSTNDIGKLHSHIRAQLSVRVSTTQLSDKVRRLKQKYQLLATRAKNGREQELHTPHDRSIYEHAKKVWGLVGSGGGDGGGSGYENYGGGDSDELQYSGDSDDDMESQRDDRYHIKNRKVRPITAANGNGIGLGAVNANGRGKSGLEKGKDAYPYLWETVEELSKEHPSGAAFKKAFEVLEGSKARAIEEKLRRFRLTEIRQQLRRMDLMKETVRMVLDALESAD
ncbi:uncharacterized protein [Aegilops tauschii subsp. strangulata]|nr:STOREKEEPER protein [Aegilops tauschii subsp. strangulata]